MKRSNGIGDGTGTGTGRLTIYHNPRCSKSREALGRMRSAGIEPRVVEYMKRRISPSELTRLLDQLGLEPYQVVRKKEERYVDLDLDKNPPKNRKEWISILCDNPVLLERPIITDGARAVLARPAKKLDKLITSAQ